MSDALSTCAEILYEEWKEGFKYGFSSAFVRGVSFQDRRRLQCCILEVLLARFGDQGFSCASCIARVHDDWNLELLFKKALCTFSLSTFKIFLRSLAAAGPGTDRTAPEAEHRDTGDRKLNYAKNFGSGFEQGFSEGSCEALQFCLGNFLKFRFGEEAQALLLGLQRITDYPTSCVLFQKLLEGVTSERFRGMLHYVEEGLNTQEQTDAELLVKKA